LRSAYKLATIVAHMYVHELSEHDLADVRRLAGPAQPCVILGYGDVAAFIGWAASLGVETVLVGTDHDELVVHGTISSDPEVPVAVKVAIDRVAIRESGLCGVVKVADLAVLAGKPVAS
jgi:hypothetical protein